MVTFDKQVVRVGEFNGSLTANRLNYERSTQGLELIAARMSELEAALKAETGFDDFHLPRQVEVSDFEFGDVRVQVKSEKRTKRPQYKTAVTEMENYLHGVAFLVSQGRAITGIATRGRSLFIGTDRILDAYDTIVAGVMQPEVKQTITYDLEGRIDDEELQAVKVGSSTDLSERNMREYVKLGMVREDLDAFVKAYEKALTRGQSKPERTRAVTRDQAYKTTKTTAEGVDWAYVVKTLVSVPTDSSVGELNVLADASVSKAEKERQMPTYKLMYREVADDRILYVAVGSVYQRIQDLKSEQTRQSTRTQVKNVVIV